MGEVKSRGEWGNRAVTVDEECLSSSREGSSSYLTVTNRTEFPEDLGPIPSSLRFNLFLYNGNNILAPALLPMDRKS